MNVTIKDIAKKANVSIATVSRVINNKSEGVGPETRERILNIIKESNYHPSRIAQGMVTKKTNILGLILPDISNPFFPDLVRGVEDTASHYGYNLVLCNSDKNSDKEEAYIRVLKENNAAGIIYTSVVKRKEKNIKLLLKNKIPFVIMDRSINISNVPKVYTNNIFGMHEMVEYLINNGHRCIAYISGPKYNSSSEQRLKGFKKALNDAGITIDLELIKDGDYSINSGKACMTEILKTGKCFTAVACANDLMALGALEVLKDKGIRVPQEISITGYDDIVMTTFTTPKLTTVVQPKYEIGCEAAELLIKLVNGEEIQQKEVILQPKLAIRESVAKRSDIVEDCSHRKY
ncbi:MAG: LacI family transcriptional regulator [Clostridia bacterium]|nr:LacI family transcriptional regulator [Clostridia bacterium]